MNSFKIIFIAFILNNFVACSPQKHPGAAEDVYEKLPKNLVSLLQSHGGLEKWRSFGTLEYDLFNLKDSLTEHHAIDLRNRKDLIVADSFKIGFDGKEVWVSPERKAFKGKSARFYHNLFFYFFAIPYVLADPGINYREDTVTLNDKTYPAILATFDAGIGDADKDAYRIVIDPETNKLYGLLYTVTYFSGEAHKNYNFLKYEDWQEAGGLQFPGKLTGYKFSNGIVGEERYKVLFSNIRLNTDTPVETLFAMPDKAEVDSLIKR